MAASIANSSAVQIEASSLMRQLNSWSSQTKDIAVLLSSFDPSVYTFRCLGNLQNNSSNMLWKTRGQVSPFLRSDYEYMRIWNEYENMSRLGFTNSRCRQLMATTYQPIVNQICFPEIENMISFGCFWPTMQTLRYFIAQIGQFIHIYYGRTFLSGPNPIKSYNRGDNLSILKLELYIWKKFLRENSGENSHKNRVTQGRCSNDFSLTFYNILSPGVIRIKNI